MALKNVVLILQLREELSVHADNIHVVLEIRLGLHVLNTSETIGNGSYIWIVYRTSIALSRRTHEDYGYVRAC